MHPDLEQAIGFHESIVAEGGKALVGYDTAKALANVVLMSEIPTSYDKKEQRQVNAGNLLLRGVPECTLVLDDDFASGRHARSIRPPAS